VSPNIYHLALIKIFHCVKFNTAVLYSYISITLFSLHEFFS